MLQEENPAWAPADGSDGSWIQARSVDVCGSTSSGAAQNDGLCAHVPWRSQARELLVPAGQPAAFAPVNRPTTPFGTPESAGITKVYRPDSKA
eukprot:8721914-Pyramimonas_sp.AAC.1